jgi:hypothetical protein
MERTHRFLGAHRIDSVYLRGQDNYAWGLLPTISRLPDYAGRRIEGYDCDRERYLLNRFRRYIWKFLGRDVNERELLLLARHHGIPVRVLDWTSNPLVALYFACSDDSMRTRDGAVWAFLRCQHEHKAFYDFFDDPKSPLELPGVKIIYGSYVSSRIPAQSCNFTVQDDPSKQLQRYDPRRYLDPSSFDIERIVKWRVSRKAKPAFLSDLERVGINERTMFPDLDGIARGIVRTEVLRAGNLIPKAERRPRTI